MLRKRTALIVLTFFCLQFVFPLKSVLFAQSNQPQPRIAVLPFTDVTNDARQDSYGEAIAGMLMTELINGRVFQVVERSQIEKIMTEMSFQLSGAVDANTAKQIGELLGVDILVFGNISKFGQLVETDIRLIDTQSGEALLAENASSRSNEELRTMVENLARKIEKRYLGRLVEEVTIQSTPTKATVWIDGVMEGVTPLTKNLALGPHKVRISMENYEVWEEEVSIVKGKNQVNPKLHPAPVSKQKVKATIKSKPLGATVYIDGIMEGTTPLTQKLTLGLHNVQISLENYNDWEKEVTIGKGKNQINPKLTPVPNPEPEMKPQPMPEPIVEKEKKGGHKTIYLIGGAALVGGGALAYLLLNKESGNEPENTKSRVTITIQFP